MGERPSFPDYTTLGPLGPGPTPPQPPRVDLKALALAGTAAVGGATAGGVAGAFVPWPWFGVYLAAQAVMTVGIILHATRRRKS